jgi:hypothetical protein
MSTEYESTLPVSYNGETFEFPVRLIRVGHVHHFLVLIDETEVFFEKDEQDAYRALVYDPAHTRLPEPGLLQAICEVLGSL